jgi:hypothetical protein
MTAPLITDNLFRICAPFIQFVPPAVCDGLRAESAGRTLGPWIRGATSLWR